MKRSCAAVLALLVGVTAFSQESPSPTMASVLAAADESDWRRVEQRRLLYLVLDRGVVVFELAPSFAPKHVANIERLADRGYWDGLAIVRSQDNYVVQWGDPNAGTPAARPLGDVQSLAPEFFAEASGGFRSIGSTDSYAPQVGFAGGFPAASDGDRSWLTHCYGMLGVGRGTEPDSGSGAQLYVVTGHAPRHLDRNVTLVGRVVHGIERLSSLPRGTGPLGFYEGTDEHVPIRRIRLGSQLPPEERLPLERLRTDTPTFAELVEARRFRREDWFIEPAGSIGVCNVPLPVRQAAE